MPEHDDRYHELLDLDELDEQHEFHDQDNDDYPSDEHRKLDLDFIRAASEAAERHAAECDVDLELVFDDGVVYCQHGHVVYDRNAARP